MDCCLFKSKLGARALAVAGLMVLLLIISSSTEPVHRIMSLSPSVEVIIREQQPQQESTDDEMMGTRSSSSASSSLELMAITDSRSRTDNDDDSSSSSSIISLETLEGLLTPTEPSGTKLTADGQIDWSCYDHIELYHTRKAGGSSLYNWAKHVARKHNLTIDQQEGTCYDPRDWKGDNRRVFVFTSLRPPVDRVISSYEYDGVQTSRKTVTLEEFVHRANDANDGVDGAKNQRTVWRYGVTGAAAAAARNNNNKSNNKKGGSKNKNGKNNKKGGTRKPRRPKKLNRVKLTRGWVWRCATNCYSKWFGGWPLPEPDTQIAVQRLDELEIIWMNNFQNPSYMGWFLHRWDAKDIPMVHLRKTKSRVKKNYTEQEMNLLHSSNWKDQLLYEALRKKWSRLTQIQLL